MKGNKNMIVMMHQVVIVLIQFLYLGVEGALGANIPNINYS